jgi:exopolysaccharide biosynthesis polyprenyl glycosylphosphotransferase
MSFFSKKEYFVHFLGDVFFFVFSLWLALFLRHLTLPTNEFFWEHLIPFSFLFVLWILVFYVSGLYDKQTMISRKKLPSMIINAQIVNGIISVFFFYLSPYFGITPKTNLFLCLLFSSVLIIFWRLIIVRLLRFGRKQSVIVLVTSSELEEIAQELKENRKYNFDKVEIIDLREKKHEEIAQEVEKRINQKTSLILLDFQNEKTQLLISGFYGLIFSGIAFIDAQKAYEELFDKVPLSIVRKHWFLKNFYSQKTTYDSIKRLIDFVSALFLFFLSLIFYPFVFLGIKIEDNGPVFIVQTRIGHKGEKIKIVKFRSMKTNDAGVWVEEQDERITKFGGLIRKTRIDELPQLWNVIKGDISLIGPRPDIIGLRDKLEKEITYYKIRDLVRPGLSGWAQIKQENPPQSVKETKERLMYDLYYIKNRSLALDLKIALRTIQILASRAGI